ncbi:MAG: histidinol-phosphate transaminase [Nitrospirota bacterium]
MNIKSLVKPNIRSLRAYHAEEIPCSVKLDANESPYGVMALKTVKTNRYPDPEAKSLRNILARQFEVKPENILHGNGSDELIQCLITTFGGPVLFPTPTFSMYRIISQAQGEESTGIPLDEKFDLDIEEMLKAVRKRDPKLIFLSSPNNPTGNSFSAERILKIIRQSKGLVIVDEAYKAFSDKKSFLPLLKKYQNLIILKTLSKIGLAGLRVGFMIAHKDVIDEVNKVRLPFNLNSLSQKLAVETLKKSALMRSEIKAIVSERKKLFDEMKKIKGIEPYPSDANFILFRTDESDKIYKELLKRGILIRNMKGVIDGCLRVTVGTPNENRAFLKAIKSAV